MLEEKKKAFEFAEYKIVALRDCPHRMQEAAAWFHSKWKVPVQAYLDSMQQSLRAKNGVPQWYVVLQEQDKIVAGMGVIENDFYKRKDLTPNLCALYVESELRRHGIARELLVCACRALAAHGVEKVYLITAHTSFYERCGWAFCGMVPEEDGGMVRVYCRSTAPAAELQQ